MLRIASVRAFLLALVLLAAGRACFAQVAITVSFAPPEIPVYEQPPCPADDYIWTPGYWAWDPDAGDYYWVPGTWVAAPQPGFFWTPPYWGWVNNAYTFYPGYWGPQVGFYGGIVYGFGYFGVGFVGGRWQDGHFFYNRYVSNVNVTVIHNVYETRVDRVDVNVARVSFNGGRGGINARPTAQEEAYGRERHVEATSVQRQHIEAAQRNEQFRASANHGKPPVAATARPGEFSGHDVVAARAGGNYTPPPNRGGNHPPEENRGAENNRSGGNAVHPKELPEIQHSAAPNTGNAKLDQKYQQQQDKLYQKQNQERQALQQKQDQEHQRAQQHNYSQAQNQQMEQRHQQQTQQLAQRHAQQQQQLQQRQAPRPEQHR
jgi:hypothetical protein